MIYSALPRIWYNFRKKFITGQKQPLAMLNEELKNEYIEAVKHNLASVSVSLK